MKLHPKAGRTDGAKISAAKRARRFVGAVAAILAMNPAAASPAVATIAPLHSLLQNIVGETGEAHLLTAPGVSPHHARLSPSQARLLHNAAAIFYLDESFEPFIARPLRAAPENAPVRLGDKLRVRQYGGGEHHSEHDERGHDDHSDEHHSEHDEHGHEKHHNEHENHAAHNGKERDDHEHSGADFHIWLDADLARNAARQMARKLAEVNPARAAEYEDNLRRLEKRLSELDSQLRETLAQARGRPFMTMHDGYQYFARRYGLTSAGALRGGHSEALSAKRLRDARRELAESGAVCVFGEPQLPARQLEALTENLHIKTGVLDPLGANLEPGADLYFDLMRQMADAFARCLSPS